MSAYFTIYHMIYIDMFIIKAFKHLQRCQRSETLIIKYTLTFISYLFDNILSDCFVKKYVMFFVDLW